jgi:hypothetical protein
MSLRGMAIVGFSPRRMLQHTEPQLLYDVYLIA